MMEGDLQSQRGASGSDDKAFLGIMGSIPEVAEEGIKRVLRGEETKKGKRLKQENQWRQLLPARWGPRGRGAHHHCRIEPVVPRFLFFLDQNCIQEAIVTLLFVEYM